MNGGSGVAVLESPTKNRGEPRRRSPECRASSDAGKHLIDLRFTGSLRALPLVEA